MDPPQWLHLVTSFIMISAAFQQTEKVPALSMEGRHFKTAVWEQTTTMKYIKDTNGTIIGYSGVSYELFDWLSHKLKFTYTVVPMPYFRVGPLPNGSWIGAHELLRKKEVDFISCGILLVPVVKEILDFTATSAEVPDVFLVPYPKEESRLLAPIKPFTFAVWLFTIGCVIIVSITIYGTVMGEKRLLEKYARIPRINIVDVGLAVIGVTFGQTEFSEALKRSLRMRIFLSFFCLTTVVLVNSYTGIFISFATSPKLDPVPEDADDIAFRSELRYIGFSFQDMAFFANSSSRALKKFGEAYRNPQNIYPSPAAAAEKVATGCCTFLLPRNVLDAWLAADLKKHGYCRCTITEKPALWDLYAFGCQKGSPFCQFLSKGIMVAKEMGLINYWWNKELKTPYQCLHPEKPDYRRLTVNDLSGVFLVLIAGISFSTTVFIIELFKKKLFT